MKGAHALAPLFGPACSIRSHGFESFNERLRRGAVYRAALLAHEFDPEFAPAPLSEGDNGGVVAAVGGDDINSRPALFDCVDGPGFDIVAGCGWGLR